MMALTATVLRRKKDGLGLVALLQLTASGNYATGGDSVDIAAKVGYTNRQPDFVLIKGKAGYDYEWDGTNKTVIVRQVAGFTPAGTVAAPVFTGTPVKPGFTVKNGTIVTNGTLGLSADAANANLVGGTGITTDRDLTTTSPVDTVTPAGTNSAPAFTGAAVAAGALSELPASSYPSGVTGDTILVKAEWIAAPQLSA